MDFRDSCLPPKLPRPRAVGDRRRPGGGEATWPSSDIEKTIRGALAPAAGKPKVATALGVGVSTVMRISSAAAA